MLGLGDYTSSDEEGTSAPVQDETSAQKEQTPVAADHGDTGTTPLRVPVRRREVGPHNASELTKPAQDTRANGQIWLESSLPVAPSATLRPSDGPVIGPAPGPSGPLIQAGELPSDSGSAPQSPYSSSRLMIRNLTMPPVPNFDIPPSPPGSPPPGPTAKFRRFLELKEQGVHFNEKLEKSSALRNPSLLQKLMDFAGISEEDQYASVLPAEVAVPTSFPAWAYADRLAKTQQEITKKRETEKAKRQREAIDFVPSTGSGPSSRGATPGSTAGRSMRGSAAERVMAGLDKDKPRSPMTHDGTKRKETERRRTRFDDTRSRFRSKSRSPRRKRSRSRSQSWSRSR